MDGFSGCLLACAGLGAIFSYLDGRALIGVGLKPIKVGLIFLD